MNDMYLNHRSVYISTFIGLYIIFLGYIQHFGGVSSLPVSFLAVRGNSVRSAEER